MTLGEPILVLNGLDGRGRGAAPVTPGRGQRQVAQTSARSYTADVQRMRTLQRIYSRLKAMRQRTRDGWQIRALDARLDRLRAELATLASRATRSARVAASADAMSRIDEQRAALARTAARLRAQGRHDLVRHLVPAYRRLTAANWALRARANRAPLRARGALSSLGIEFSVKAGTDFVTSAAKGEIDSVDKLVEQVVDQTVKDPRVQQAAATAAGVPTSTIRRSIAITQRKRKLLKRKLAKKKTRSGSPAPAPKPKSSWLLPAAAVVGAGLLLL